MVQFLSHLVSKKSLLISFLGGFLISACSTSSDPMDEIMHGTISYPFIEQRPLGINRPKEKQDIIRLFYAEEYSITEISAFLKIPIGTVKSRLFKAREKLKSILNKIDS